MKDWMRKDLRDYKPYHVPNIPCEIKLDANESPFCLPTRMKELIKIWIENDENLNQYPDDNCVVLKEKLCELWRIKPENIICGVGSDQIIEYICKAFLEIDDIVIVPSPSFSMYRLTAELNRAKVISINLKRDFTYDIDKIIETCKETQPKILFLCSPNNPTGNSMKDEDIERILQDVECPVVVDEAYADFTARTIMRSIEKYPNLIVLRTFSKAYGLAGVRVGYGVANKDFIDVLEVVRSPYNLSSIAQKIAMEAIRNIAVYKERIRYLNAEREWLLEELDKFESYFGSHKIRFYTTDANFIYIESNIDVAFKLLRQGILIKTIEPPEDTRKYKYRFRITVGEKQQNKQLLEAFDDMLKIRWEDIPLKDGTKNNEVLECNEEQK